MPVNKEFVKNKIYCGEDITLKIITEVVAYRIYKSREGMRTESDFLIAAADVVAQYLSENFTDIDSLGKQVSKLGKEMELINQWADNIFNYYQDKQKLSFEMVKDLISRVKDVDLKAITDIVAYKIYQSPNDKDPELNFISAETFVSQYISENFKNLSEFKEYLANLGDSSHARGTLADLIYNYYCQRKR